MALSQGFALILAALFAGHRIGLDVQSVFTGLYLTSVIRFDTVHVAGLGFSGVFVALGVQTLVRDLFGFITILMVTLDPALAQTP